MRKVIIAGNWKMNHSHPESLEFVDRFKKNFAPHPELEIILLPPYTSLWPLNQNLAGLNIDVGAQNMGWEAKGAFTGEISPSMLVASGCKWVLLGHSERRQYFKETDTLIQKKIGLALQFPLNIILCIGESENERAEFKTEEVLTRQIEGALAEYKEEDLKRLVIAYEPVWAIGTGKTASPEMANEAHVHIRQTLCERFGEKNSQDCLIIYGGSVNPQNSSTLIGQSHIDGALVGGASLDASSFCDIIASVH